MHEGGIMNILKKTATILERKEPQLTKRLFTGSWEAMGHIKRGIDTRTTEQLLENIDYFAKCCPEVAQFKDSLKSMNPKHLGLVSDVCELATRHEMINNAIDIRKPSSNGKSLFQFLMEKLPIASKENPAAVELTQEIINNTDSIGAKYTLGALSNLYECKEAARHAEATIPLVSDIAEATLNGGFTMDYSKERNFVKALGSFISPNVSLDKLKLLTEVNKIAENSNAVCQLNAFPFLTNKTEMSKILANLETFKCLDKNMHGKSINLTEFLEKNVNML